MTYPDVNKIILFEEGEMTQEQVVEFIQDGIDNGWVWKLQGFYGRTAASLIKQGLCTQKSVDKV